MKRVCFLMSSVSSSGGIQRSVSLVSKGLNEKNKKISIVSLFKDKKTFYEFGENSQIIKGNLTKNNDLKKNFIKVYRETNMILSKVEFDVLIIESLGLVPFVSKKILDSKKIIVVDHTGRQNFSRFGLSNLGLLISKKYADVLVVLTKKNYEEYNGYFLNSNCQLELIPNPLDPRIISHNYNKNSKKICFVGRLSREKGPDLLIEAINELNSKTLFNNWTLDMYGTGAEYRGLKEQIIKYNLEKKVFLKGENKEIYKLYNQYSFLVVPSRFESFGLVIIEAMKSRLPVVSFNAPYGPKQLISDGTNGILVERENVKKLADSIYKLMSDRELRVSFSNKSNLTLKDFEYHNVIKKWKVIIGE
ncbi:glycosyltransferase [Desemzia sp. FAM 23990]|uniref:glycosyltransferase n=1 Tax=Desemzia sp. FAM 23990 TaxID=3259520 RepID=UPI003885E4B2